MHCRIHQIYLKLQKGYFQFSFSSSCVCQDVSCSESLWPVFGREAEKSESRGASA